MIKITFRLEKPKVEDKPIKKYKLTTDSARIWEERRWKGDEFTIIKNDCEDLQIMFVKDGDESDIFDFPRTLFGSTMANISLGMGPDGKRYKFESVFLNHSAVADGEIVVIIGGAASIYSIAAGGFVQLRGYKYDDYEGLDYTDVETSYRIGTAAVAADPKIRLFGAHQIFLEATTNCLIRFNDSPRIQHLLTANIRYCFLRDCTRIYAVRQTTNGRLSIESFGWGD